MIGCRRVFTYASAQIMANKKTAQITVRNMADTAVIIAGKLLQPEGTIKIKSVSPEVRKALQNGVLQVVADGVD